jgi:hypothetical protein
MILLAINATNFTELSKIPCIFVENFRTTFKVYPQFFCLRQKNRGVSFWGSAPIPVIPAVFRIRRKNRGVGSEGFALTTPFISAN